MPFSLEDENDIPHIDAMLPPEPEQWLSLALARNLTGKNPESLKRLARENKVLTRRAPRNAYEFALSSLKAYEAEHPKPPSRTHNLVSKSTLPPLLPDTPLIQSPIHPPASSAASTKHLGFLITDESLDWVTQRMNGSCAGHRNVLVIEPVLFTDLRALVHQHAVDQHFTSKETGLWITGKLGLPYFKHNRKPPEILCGDHILKMQLIPSETGVGMICTRLLVML